jgi:hypothetical protein
MILGPDLPILYFFVCDFFDHLALFIKLKKNLMVLGHHLAEIVLFEKFALKHEFWLKPGAFRFFVFDFSTHLRVFSGPLKDAEAEFDGPGPPSSCKILNLAKK